jgi:hypothetical protein
MVRITKAQHQAEYLGYSQSLFEYAITLEEDEDDNILLDDEDFEADDQISEIIELSALQWTQLALSMSGDGSRGPYNQFPKSTDFFSTSLQAPDRYFRRMFR